MTGADLHEGKGVAAAAVDTVFVADGAGSGIHKKVPGTALAASANPFGALLLHVREQQTQGTASQSSNTTLSWVTNIVNAVMTNEIAGASLASNQITLPAGTYFLDADIVGNISSAVSVRNVFKPRLFNFTATTVLLDGLPLGLNDTATTATSIVQSMATLRGRFTLAAPSVLLIQHNKSVNNTPLASNQGVEIYLDAAFWKVS